MLVSTSKMAGVSSGLHVHPNRYSFFFFFGTAQLLGADMLLIFQGSVWEAFALINSPVKS
jgi:hypothetical protein